MSVLLLDIGNSRGKWALAEAGAVLESGVLPDRPARWPAALAALCKRHRPARALLCCVAGAARRRRVEAALQGRLPLDRFRAEAAWRGLQNAYPRPEALGADRWAALIAAWAAGGGPLCVAGCGTVLTLDLVDAHGRHLGGYLLPGLRLGRAALLRRVPHLRGAAVPLQLDPGRDTAAAIAAGGALAAVAAIERARARLPGAALWLAGGDAPSLAEHLAPPFYLEPRLVLKGLALVAAER